jgi:uncharacterized protein YjbI with pentapeptide repeats
MHVSFLNVTQANVRFSGVFRTKDPVKQLAAELVGLLSQHRVDVRAFNAKKEVLDNLLQQQGQTKSVVLRLEPNTLQGKDLPKINLSGLTLHSTTKEPLSLFLVNMTEAKLLDTKLIEADLSCTDLERADMTDCKLRRASLYRTYFRDATCIRTDFRGTERTRNTADFSGANCLGAHYS